MDKQPHIPANSRILSELPTRLHHNAYVCADQERTRHFYEDIVGLPLVATWIEQGQSPDVISKDQAATRAAYAESIQYSLNTLISFVQTYGDKNLVLVMLGDHEPASTVSGEGTTHDVPISIVSQDPAVMNRISGWGWTPGLRPTPQAPVWPMDAFRDRFLTAYNG